MIVARLCALALLAVLLAACRPSPPDRRPTLIVTPTAAATHSPAPTATVAPPSPVVAQGVLGEGVTVFVHTVDVNAQRVRLEYTLRHVPPPMRGAEPSSCPLRMTLLTDQHRFRYGHEGIALTCSRTGEGAYHVVEELRHKWRFDLGEYLDFTLHLLVDPDARALPDGSVLLPGATPGPASVLDPVYQVDDLSAEEVLTFRAPLRGDITYTEVQRVEANGVTAELRRVEINDRQLAVEVCFGLPDNRDWLPMDTRLFQGRRLFNSFNPSLLESESQAGRRCYSFPFKFQPQQVFTSRSLTLTIDGFMLLPPEGEMDQPVTCEAALQRLAERNTGLKAQCPGVDGGPLPQLLARPDGMSEDQALRLILQAYYHVEFAGGPWRFTIGGDAGGGD